MRRRRRRRGRFGSVGSLDEVREGLGVGFDGSGGATSSIWEKSSTGGWDVGE